MPLMYDKYTVAIEAEGTYGTFATLTNADAGHRFDDPVLQIISKNIPRLKANGSLGTGKSAKGPKHTTLSFKNRLHGDGSSAAAGFMPILFPCVGMPSPSSNTYRTSSTQGDWKGLSAALNRDGFLKVGRGMMGDLSIDIAAGEAFLASWNFMGGFQADPTDTSQLSGISFQDIVAPIFAGSGSLTIDSSTAFRIAKAQIKLNNGVFLRQDPNAAGGYIGGWLNNPKPTLTMDPEAVAVATKNWHNAQATGDEMDIVFVANGGAGNTVTITCTDCEPERPEEANRDGVLVDQMGFNINGTVTVAVS